MLIKPSSEVEACAAGPRTPGRAGLTPGRLQQEASGSSGPPNVAGDPNTPMTSDILEQSIAPRQTPAPTTFLAEEVDEKGISKSEGSEA